MGELPGYRLRHTGCEGENASVEPFTNKTEPKLNMLGAFCPMPRDWRVIRLHGAVDLPFLPLRHL